MDEENGRPGRSDATLWKIVAQFTRENAERDVRIAQLERDLRRVDEVDQRLGESMRRRERMQEDIAALKRRLDTTRGLTDEESHLLRRLDEAIKQRGSLELLSEVEIDEVRSGMRRVPELADQRAELRQEIAGLNAWKNAAQMDLAERRQVMHAMQNKLDDLVAWRDAHRDQVDDLLRTVATLQQERPTTEDQMMGREALKQWQDFHEKYEKPLIEVAEHMMRKKSRADKIAESLAVNWRAQLIGAVVAVLILVPGSQLVIELFHAFFGGK